MGCTGVNLAAKTLLQSVVESEGACEAARDETEGACEAARDETEGACEAARDETETEREVGGVAWEVERDVDRAADVARSLRRYAGLKASSSAGSETAVLQTAGRPSVKCTGRCNVEYTPWSTFQLHRRVLVNVGTEVVFRIEPLGLDAPKDFRLPVLLALLC